MKTNFTVCLENQDIERLKEAARKMNIPPRVLARSILLKGLDTARFIFLEGEPEIGSVQGGQP